MGNNLSGFPSAQEGHIKDLIVDIQHFIDVKEEFNGSRIFKVAKVIDRKSIIHLLKIFVNKNDNFSLENAIEQMNPFFQSIKNGFNLLPYTIVLRAPNSVGILRDYVDQSLLERLSTRPFLLYEEKLWISFQILRSLDQLHSNQLYHGDLKMENFLVTGWGWVFLTDPAPFKTVQLPSDNPSEFTYLFDNSRRRACYLSPERFYERDSSKLVDETGIDVANEMGNMTENLSRPISSQSIDKLLPEMDLFSAGCIILELLSDGIVPFTLSDLLAYRAGNNARLELLLNNNIPKDNEHFHEVLNQLLSRDMNQRMTAIHYITTQRGRLFPEIFYGPFYAFMQSFLVDSLLQNLNYRLSYIAKSLPDILLQISANQEQLRFACILLVSLITDCLRPYSSEGKTIPSPMSNASLLCSHNDKNQTKDLNETAKINAIRSLGFLIPHLKCIHNIDRILPYLFDIVLKHSRHSVEVRVYALDTIGEILKRCTERISPNNVDEPENKELLESLSDFNLLAEYLMRMFNQIRSDDDLVIRLSIVRNLPYIIDLSFLIYMNTRKSFNEKLGDIQTAYAQLKTNRYNLLKEQIKDRVVSLFQDPSIIVRQALVETNNHESAGNDSDPKSLVAGSTLVKIAALLGRQWTCNVLLSHLITFFNDKNADDLRVAFYKQIPSLTRFAGVQSVSLIRPILDQGLQENNIFVLESCMQSLTLLLKNQSLSGNIAIEFFQRIISFAIHPYMIVRMAAIHYITTFAQLVLNNFEKKALNDKNVERVLVENPLEIFTPGSVYARLSSSRAKSIFKKPIKYNATNEKYLFDNLRPPLTRYIVHNFLDQFILIARQKCESVGEIVKLYDQTFEYLNEKYFPQLLGKSLFDNQTTSPVNETLQKMKQIAINDLKLSQLTLLADQIRSMLYSQLLGDGKKKSPSQSTNSNSSIYNFALIGFLNSKLKTVPICLLPTKTGYSMHGRKFSHASLSHKAMDQKTKNDRRNEKTDDHWIRLLESNLSKNIREDRRNLPVNETIKTDVLANNPEKFYGRLFKVHTDPSTNSPNAEQVIANVIGRHKESSSSRPPPQISRMKGILIAHFHEHENGILKLVTHPTENVFVSTSSGDGFLRLWSCNFTMQRESVNSIQSNQVDINSLRYIPFHSMSTIDVNSALNIPVTKMKVDKFKCQDISWIDSGDKLVGVFNNSSLLSFDVKTGGLCSTNDFDVEKYGKISAFATPETTSFEAMSNLLSSSMDTFGGMETIAHSASYSPMDLHAFAVATTSSQILIYDSRCEENRPAFSLKQDQALGMVTAMSLHSCKSWLVTGTSTGHCVFSDLRYSRPIKVIKHSQSPNVGINTLKIFEIHKDDKSSSLIVAGLSKSSEVCIWDIDLSNTNTSTPTASLNVTNVKKCQNTAADYRDSTNCLYPYPSNLSTTGMLQKDNVIESLPNILTGGNDCHVRNWSLAAAMNSKNVDMAQNELNNSNIIAWSGFDELLTPTISHKIDQTERKIIQTVHYQTDVQSVEPTSLLTSMKSGPIEDQQAKDRAENKVPNFPNISKRMYPSLNKLAIRNPTQGHLNAISDFTIVRTPHGQSFLVSASCDGIIKFWN